MTMDPVIHARSEWTSRPPKTTPTRVTWSQIKIVDIHWPARAGKIARDRASIVRALQAFQRFHMDTRGWNDIAYNVAVDLNGDVWILRGWSVQDGGVAGRRDDVTVLLVMGTDDTMTEAMKRSTVWAMRQFANLKGGELVRSYHGALSPTTCPGPGPTAWAKAGFPLPTIAAREDDDDMPTPQDLINAMEAANPGWSWGGRNASSADKKLTEVQALLVGITAALEQGDQLDLEAVRSAVSEVLAAHTERMDAVLDDLRQTVDQVRDQLPADAAAALAGVLDRAREAVTA